jgi:PPP family 3-phenylpropionic acid transporter
VDVADRSLVKRLRPNRVWPFSFSFFLMASVASVVPIRVLFYQELGFTGAQIGLLSGVGPLVTLVAAPLWAGLADATKRHRTILSGVLLVGTALLFVSPLPTTFSWHLMIILLLSAFLAPVASFADSATMFMLGDQREMFGRIRLGGTIGYGLTAAIVGTLVEDRGLRWAFWASAALVLLALMVSQRFSYDPTGRDSEGGGDVRRLLATPRWRLFLLLALAVGLTHAATDTYFFPYMKELGASASKMGFALTLGTISEIPVLFFGDRLIKRLRAQGLLLVAMGIAGFRFLLFAASGTPNHVLVIQLLNGLTLPAMWLAGVSYADEHAPTGLRTTAQGLFSAMVLGVGSGAGGLFGWLPFGAGGGTRHVPSLWDSGACGGGPWRVFPEAIACGARDIARGNAALSRGAQGRCGGSKPVASPTMRSRQRLGSLLDTSRRLPMRAC